MSNYLEITDLKDMLNKTRKLYGDRPAYKIKVEDGKYKTYTHEDARKMIDSLGTSLCNMGLKDKRIGVIGENRFEWEIAYMSIICGTGIAVPLDKSLPENELRDLIERSEVEAIFFSGKYLETMNKIKDSQNNKLEHLISIDLAEHESGVYSQIELINSGRKLLEEGNKEFINAQIDSEKMCEMLFTSGTTSKSKVVALSHKNLCANLMGIVQTLDVNSNDRILSFLPLHHVFLCMMGCLLSLYIGSEVDYCDGMRYIQKNLVEYKTTFACFVPAIYESMYKNLIKKFEQEGRLGELNELTKKYKNESDTVKKEVFKEIHEAFGGCIRLFISGAAPLDKNVEQAFRDWGINLCQAYGLTETSPVLCSETKDAYRVGSIGKTIPNVEARIDDANEDGIGELVVKGPNIMIGYYGDEKATKEVLEPDGWFHTGDLARIDEDGYVFICGRKKSVIVLKNGKNIFPEEMEILVNKIEGVKDSFIYGKRQSEDKNDIKINVAIVIDREKIKYVYKVEENEEIYNVLKNEIKKINQMMPNYKAIRGVIITETPLIKTSTGKIKRQANLEVIEKNKLTW